MFRWVVLFTHPADFTPVCTTELGRIAVHHPAFAKRNVKLLAHSVDDLKEHVDWVSKTLFPTSCTFFIIIYIFSMQAIKLTHGLLSLALNAV